MKRILAFVLLLTFYVTAAQDTEVSGTALGHPGELVRVKVYTDQFSRLDSTLASAETDAWGNFSLTFPLEKTDYAFLTLGLKEGEFYLEPGYAYRAFIRSDTVQGSVFDQLPLQFDLKEENRGLNSMIEEFNFDYNTFILQHQKQLLRAKPDKLITEFINREKSKFSDELHENEYFKNYLTYSFASLEWISKVKSDTTILEEYIIGKDVLYENIAYTDLFRDFFKEYFKDLKTFDYPALVDAFNKGSLSYIDSLVQQDKWLAKDGQVRQLAMMQLMARNYYNKDIDHQKILEIFTEIEKSGNNVRNKTIAGNFKRKLLKLGYGTKAPVFALKNEAGKKVSLEDFAGKFVLLDFITSDCRPCLYDMKKLQDIQAQFETKLEVVVIVADRGAVKTELPVNSGHFHTLYLGKQLLLLEDYEIRTYPAYIILNPDGTVAMAPAPLPDENLDVFVERFILRYEKQNKGKQD